jgi:hypothetical protein
VNRAACRRAFSLVGAHHFFGVLTQRLQFVYVAVNQFPQRIVPSSIALEIVITEDRELHPLGVTDRVVDVVDQPQQCPDAPRPSPQSNGPPDDSEPQAVAASCSCRIAIQSLVMALIFRDKGTAARRSRFSAAIFALPTLAKRC